MTDLVLYDGVCGLCDRSVQFLLARDRRDHFRFAPLQSQLAREALGRHGIEPTGLDTIWVIADYQEPAERALDRSRAVRLFLRRLGGAWRLLEVFGILPRFVLDRVYDLVAGMRYRIFGRLETCRVPTADERRKFLDTV
jgi:predicted DCC family thiol-disulfide oxidoreductase YuxK